MTHTTQCMQVIAYLPHCQVWGCRTKVRGITLAFPTLLTTRRPVSLRGPIRTDHHMDILVAPLAPKVRACLSACSRLSCTFLVILIARMYTYGSFLIHFYTVSFYCSVCAGLCEVFSLVVCVGEVLSQCLICVVLSAKHLLVYLLLFLPYLCLFCTLIKNSCVLRFVSIDCPLQF